MEKNMNELFSTEKIDDLPAFVQQQLKEGVRASKGCLELGIFQLLKDAAEPVNIDQILVGLYRRYGFQKKRSSVASCLHRMKNSNDIPVRGAEGMRGYYEIGLDIKRLMPVVAEMGHSAVPFILSQCVPNWTSFGLDFSFSTVKSENGATIKSGIDDFVLK